MTAPPRVGCVVSSMLRALHQLLLWADLALVLEGACTDLANEDIVYQQSVIPLFAEGRYQLSDVDDLPVLARTGIQVDGELDVVGVVKRNEEDVCVESSHHC